jgi:hypothetical protein
LWFFLVDARRDDIALDGEVIGQSVEIDSFVTGWDGWNRNLRARLSRARKRRQRAVLLEPRVDLVVAWISLPLFELR